MAEFTTRRFDVEVPSVTLLPLTVRLPPTVTSPVVESDPLDCAPPIESPPRIVVVAAVRLPVKYPSPLTESVLPGEVVPIPTFPPRNAATLLAVIVRAVVSSPKPNEFDPLTEMPGPKAKELLPRTEIDWPPKMSEFVPKAFAAKPPR